MLLVGSLMSLVSFMELLLVFFLIFVQDLLHVLGLV